MASIPFSKTAVKSVKKSISKFYHNCPSSHLTESLASALGFKTHAALLSSLESDSQEPLYRLLSEKSFNEKLSTFGVKPVSHFRFFDDAHTPEMINTDCPYAHKYNYKSKRNLAWRNLIVCGINQALKLRIFSIDPNQNYWQGSTYYQHDVQRWCEFDFNLPCGFLARVRVQDIGHAEISIHVWFTTNRDFSKGNDGYARSWLERKEGAWIQSVLLCSNALYLKRHITNVIADIKVEPFGFGDHGSVM